MRKWDLSSHSVATVPVLLGIIALSTVVRIWAIYDTGLRYGETQSVIHALQGFADTIASVGIHDPHPSLYYLQLNIWAWLGTSDTWLKLNSVFWSVLAIPLIFSVGRRLFNSQTAILASVIFAISPLAIFYALQVRMYALLMFLCILSFYLLLKYMEKNQRPYVFGLLLVAAITATTYSHGTGFLILLPLGVYFLVERIREHGTFRIDWLELWPFVLGGVLALPWLYHARGTSLGHLELPTLSWIPHVLGDLVFSPLGAAESITIIVGVILVFLMALGFIFSRRSWPLLVSAALVPMSAIAVLSYIVTPLWNDRTLAFLFPLLSILVARLMLWAIEKFSGMGSKSQTALAVSSVSICLLLFPALTKVANEEEYFNGIRWASAFVDKQHEATDVILVPHDRDFWGATLYLSQRGSFRVNSEEYLAIANSGATMIRDHSASAVIKDVDRIWLVQRRGRDPVTVEGFEISENTSLPEIEVKLLERASQ